MGVDVGRQSRSSNLDSSLSSPREQDCSNSIRVSIHLYLPHAPLTDECSVDHSSYMSTLAADMGAAPSLKDLYNNHGIHVLVAYCLGAAFVSFYRLEGPFKSAEMDEIVTTELWETITRRGLIGNIFMGIVSSSHLV